MTDPHTTSQLRIVIWRASGDARVVPVGPDDHWKLTVETRDLDEPHRLTIAASRLVGVPLEFIRTPTKDSIEFAIAGDHMPERDSRLIIDRMVPPLSARPTWHRPGWIRDVLTQVSDLLAGTGTEMTGPARPVRHTTVTGLLRVAATDGELWVKVMPESFSLEGPLSQFLHAKGHHVPDVVVTAPGLAVMRPFPPATPSEDEGHYLVDLARLQVSLLGEASRLREIGVPELPVDSLPRAIGPGSGAERHSGPLRSMLASTLEVVQDVCSQVRRAQIPPALVHGDLHDENVRHTSDGWFLFDWTDASLSYPFVDIAVANERGAALPSRVVDAVLAEWSGELSESQLELCRSSAAILGAAHQVANYAGILDIIEPTAADRSCGTQIHAEFERWVRCLHRAVTGVQHSRQPISEVAT